MTPGLTSPRARGSADADARDVGHSSPLGRISGHRRDRRDRRDFAAGGPERVGAGQVRGLLYAAGGRRLLSYGGDGRLRLWDPARAVAAGGGGAVGVNYGHLARDRGRGWCGVQMAERGGGRIVCVPRGRDVVAVEVESGRQARVLTGHRDDVAACASQVRHGRRGRGRGLGRRRS